MQFLDIFDDLEADLMRSTSKVYRFCIPAVAGTGPRNPIREGNFTASGSDDVSENPKPSKAERVKGSDPHSRSRIGLDLRISLDALKQPNQEFINGFEKILEMKFGIMASRIRHGLDTWSLASYMVNPFESLPFVAAPSVLNRAYFKMWELIHLFKVVPTVSQSQTFLSAHLCEGPGGFIEAIQDYRAQSVILDNGSRTSHEDTDDGFRETAGDVIVPANNSHKCVPERRSDTAVYGSPNFGSSRINDGHNAQHSSNRLKLAEHDIKVSHAMDNRRRPKLDVLCFSENSRRHQNMNGSLPNSSPSPPLSKTICSALADGELDREDATVEQISACGKVPVSHSLRNSEERLKSSSFTLGPRGEERILLENCERICSKATTRKQYRDMWFGITLASKQQRGNAGYPPPRMETAMLNRKVARNSTGHVHYGVDGSGDITNPANVHAFVEHTLGKCNGQKMDLVTADGAFDVSEDFSSQEHSHLYLIFCELVSAVRLQAKGGSFILKLFDCYTESTLTVLCILSALYSRVEIVRLRTTRICNSERYVVATGFLGLDPTFEETLLKLNVQWKSSTLRGEKVGLCFLEGLPARLLEAVMESNAAISATQIDGIGRALQLADVIGERLPCFNSLSTRKGTLSMLRRKLQTLTSMQRNAVALCKELHIRCRSQVAAVEIPCV